MCADVIVEVAFVLESLVTALVGALVTALVSVCAHMHGKVTRTATHAFVAYTTSHLTLAH